VLLLVIAGAVIWWLLSRDDSGDEVDAPSPEISVSTGTGTPAN
jgi:hypothetical protein